MTSIPRESVEFIRFDDLLVDGEAADVDQVEVSVTRLFDRPTTWTEPVQLDGQLGVLTGDYPAGDYTVWVRVITSGLEKPVINMGRLTIT